MSDEMQMTVSVGKKCGSGFTSEKSGTPGRAEPDGTRGGQRRPPSCSAGRETTAGLARTASLPPESITRVRSFQGFFS